MLCVVHLERSVLFSDKLGLARCAVVVRPLVGLNVLLLLFREQEKDGERWSEREGGGCEGTSTNPTMLKDTPNEHLVYQVSLSYSENITIPEIFHTVIYL